MTYSIAGGDDDGKFDIDESTGEITLPGTLDYLAVPTYTLTVQASDESGGTATVTVEVAVTAT